MKTHSKTFAEYETAAMLLGWGYDPGDHTYFTLTGRLVCFDPDTLEKVFASAARSEKYRGYCYPGSNP